MFLPIFRPLALLAVISLALALVQSAPAQTRLRGEVRYEKIKGRPALGYRGMYEANLFLVPSDASTSIARSRRLGTTTTSGSTCTGCLCGGGVYCISDMDRVNGADNQPIVAGTYSAWFGEPLFYHPPAVFQNIVIQNGQDLLYNPELPIDYSTYFFDDWVGNTGQGDHRPPSTPWYQTFKATGTGIRAATFCYAGANPSSIRLAILEDNGNANPAMWTLIGERIVSNPGGGLNDNWVRWRADEIPTTPGTTYALRIHGVGGPNNGGLQPYVRSKDANSYAHGMLYDGLGVAQNDDCNATVFSDNDGTIVTTINRSPGIGVLKSPYYFGTRWGQTFTALGTSLAGCELKASTGVDGLWEIDFRWKVFLAGPSGPAGPQIGPTKITNAAWNASAFHQAVSYNKSEVPLTPGTQYFIQWEMYNPPPQASGFNPWLADSDPYPGGHGWWWNAGSASWEARANDDVNMSILEYKLDEPELVLNPTSITGSVYKGNNKSPGSFTVSNIGFHTLNYTITDNVGWLSVNPPGGSVDSGQFNTITINYNTSGLTCGEYNATITVDGNAYNAPQTLGVTIVVYTVGPDMDCDDDADQNDFGAVQACFTGPGVTAQSPCDEADFDNDNDVDQDDLVLFLGCAMGQGVVIGPGCLE